MSSTIRVNILDREYALRVKSDDDAQMTRRIAAYVDERLRSFRQDHPDRPEMTGAIITALAITEELFEARDAISRTRNETDLHLADLDDMLARVIDE